MKSLIRISLTFLGLILLTSCLSSPNIADSVTTIAEEVGCPLDVRVCLYPSWSPDGSKLAFVAEGSQYGPLVISNADLGELRSVLDIGSFPEGLYSQPVWAPDGHQIAFHLVTRSTSQGIYAVDLRSQRLQKLIDLPYGASGLGLNWSPDSQQLLYIKNDEYGKVWVCIANTDGTNEKWIKEINYPAVAAGSPDGKKIAFISDNGDGRTDLFVMNVDGSDTMRLSDNGLTEWEEHIAWSPDSQKLAYTAIDESYKTLLYIVNGDGTGKQLVSNDHDYNDLAWSPDGHWLVIIEAYQLSGYEGGSTNMVKLRVDS